MSNQPVLRCRTTQCPLGQGQYTSNWNRLPLTLHRIATVALISLTVLQLHSSERSLTLAAVFLALAAVGIVVDKSSLFSSDRSPASASKTLLAVSLVRATIYAFTGDVAAAQLL
ncbi:2232_t:CDS:1, partial [Acaulospora colombiana]